MKMLKFGNEAIRDRFIRSKTMDRMALIYHVEDALEQEYLFSKDVVIENSDLLNCVTPQSVEELVNLAKLQGFSYCFSFYYPEMRKILVKSSLGNLNFHNEITEQTGIFSQVTDLESIQEVLEKNKRKMNFGLDVYFYTDESTQ